MTLFSGQVQKHGDAIWPSPYRGNRIEPSKPQSVSDESLSCLVTLVSINLLFCSFGFFF